MDCKLKKIGLTLLFSLSLFGESGWYLGNTCESIKEFHMKTPLDFISEYGCKPNVGNNIEVSAEMGLLAFDCRNTDLKGYMNLVFGKENCLKIKNSTEKRMDNK